MGRGHGLGVGVSAVASGCVVMDGLSSSALPPPELYSRSQPAPDHAGCYSYSPSPASASPSYQAHLGTSWSMDKHMSVCTWFLAIAAGYAFAYVSKHA